MFSKFRLHILLLVGLLLAIARFPAQTTSPPAIIDKPMQIYLLIGQSNMAERAEIPKELEGIIDRCLLLNEKNEWEPARNRLNRHSPIRKDPKIQRLGPWYSFAKKMLETSPDATIGLIVNARGGTSIDEWLGKSELYWSARKRCKAAMKDGTLKGVLWHQGESDQNKADEYLG